ncbi:phytanoyl-CoA dioxygenase family protein [Ilyonectria robusta]|uniref:phytanoyl-CoA dioxygenase family protein n=1 Tax=Ilyonectria robusta TaxID=1079257 RepID=UPI001E8D17EB|nr:phytanoyl-CoA dioxygenase family protein [Ilyonectria robusta]KAH6974116.1 phytanoyl-CoA dioxygenase family protein [Ilyonectria sp. MPI-CAGE-AT-0026]KAH8666073.1 phytanoyl-CoA dioxygenase family protein [Ilyonectria robusta]
MAVTSYPSIQRIDRSDVEGIINALTKDGGCIVKNFTDAATVDQVNAETRPYLDADLPWKGDLFPPETRRCANLARRSKTVREKWLVDPLIRACNAKFVDKTTSNYYGETKHTYTSEAVCSIAVTFEIGPGGKAQRLHRDDKNYHVHHPDQTQTGYQVGTDVMMAFLVPGVKTTVENGATLAIPGSHLWSSDRVPKTEEALYAEMDIGDCWIMLGGLYHAGGANVTQLEKRSVHGMFFIRGYLRQEENIYLATPPEEVLTWSEKAQKALGYTLSSPNIGFVEFFSPIPYLKGERNTMGDFDASQEKKE